MKQKQFKDTAKVYKALQVIAQAIQISDKAQIMQTLGKALDNPLFASKGWQNALNKLSESIQTGNPSFSIFALSGNIKLPFVSFSTLPGGSGCPGAGECLNFCYSFSTWRHPAAFMRQAQNTYFMRFNRGVITQALSDITVKPKFNQGFDFRLYVDGDFMDVGQVAYWSKTLKDNPLIQAYGYSKSFSELLRYEELSSSNWPSNYKLNISSGHNSDNETLERVKALPVVRGEFVAVSLGRKVNSSEHGTQSNNKAVRQAIPDVKVFPCPGKCGACTPKGHACGLESFRGITIAIAVH